MRVFTTVRRSKLSAVAASVFFLALLVNVAGPSAEQRTDQVPIRCAAIENPTERLQCFDDWVKGQSAAKPEPKPATPESMGKWSIKAKEDPIDDSQIIQLQLESDSGRARFGKKPMLIVYCQSKAPYLAIWWHDYIGLDNSQVTTRIDREKPTTMSWPISNTGDATLLQEPALAGFVQRLLNGEQLAVEVAPVSSPRITATFDITGLRDAIKPYSNVCKFA
jgi:type VI secretion system protein VasI